MGEHTVRRLLILLLPLLLGSCNAYFPHLRVIRANYNVSRGEYQPAIVDYLRARESTEYTPWLAYNLGTVYHYLGESGAAVDQWDAARSSDVADLQYGAAFNRGVFLFEQGRFDEAFQEFRFALSVNPASRAAKANLELTLERLEAGAGLDGDATRSNGEPGDAGAGGAGDDGGTTRMLDYVRRKEEQRWRANSEIAPPAEARDW